MENASKALIIAGAILLSILIIALGIYVFNMAKGASNTDQLDALEISTFNDKFTTYEGRQIGSSVKQLLNEVITNNNKNKEAQERLIDVHYVKGTGTLNSENIEPNVGDSNLSKNMSTLRSALSSTHFYTVSIGYDDAGAGYVNSITINY